LDNIWSIGAVVAEDAARASEGVLVKGAGPLVLAQRVQVWATAEGSGGV
jgi:hypothetical protein